MEILNTFDEVQEDVVDSLEDAEDSEEVTDDDYEVEETTDEETELSNESGEVAQPQSQEDNAKYAAARRAAEAEKRAAEQKAAELEAQSELMRKQIETLTQATKLYGYEGTPEEISDQLIAAQRDITPEEVKLEREAFDKEIEKRINSHPAIKNAENLALQTAMDKELQEIQKLNPEIRSLKDLQGNDEFDDLVINHGVSLSKAYKLTHVKQPVTKVNTKEHLTGINTGDKSNDGMVEVPKTDLAFLKESFPDDSPAKLKERYNRILKRTKGE